MTSSQRKALAKRLSPRLTSYIPHRPTTKQAVFLRINSREAFYGGAAGGGKSDALLMAALQYVDIPNYSAILFRKTFQDLKLPGALMDRAQQWLMGSSARWAGQDHKFVFPSGAVVQFGYLDGPNDKFRYQSAEFQFIGFDELTQFKELDYRYLLSRARRLKGSQIPIRIRSASNPGGIGHEWVKDRFVTYGNDRPFIPATVHDNPYLDVDDYVQSLAQLDPITRQQLLDGDWNARVGGSKFRREWFEIVDAKPATAKTVRYWDLAGTEPTEGTDPDWTAGVKMSKTDDGLFIIEDVVRTRSRPRAVENLVVQTSQLDGLGTHIHVEQEPGASGKAVVEYYVRLLAGYSVHSDRPTGDKFTRMDPLSSQAEAGNVKLLHGEWIRPFLDEAESIPDGAHDDQLDAAAGAFNQLNAHPPLLLM